MKLLIIFMLIPFSAFSITLEKGIDDFLNGRVFSEKCNIAIGSIAQLETGKRWDLSEKIKTSLLNGVQGKRNITVIGDSKELRNVRDKSVTGSRVIAVQYLITGTYEIKEENVWISLNVTSVDEQWMTLFAFQVELSSIKAYLKDYSDSELSLIIKKQEEKIKGLVKEQRTARKKDSMLREIVKQKEILRRIEDGKIMITPRYLKQVEINQEGGKSLGVVGLVIAGFGYYSQLVADGISENASSKDLEAKEISESVATGMYAFSALIFVTATAMYFYHVDDYTILLHPVRYGGAVTFAKSF